MLVLAKFHQHLAEPLGFLMCGCLLARCTVVGGEALENTSTATSIRSNGNDDFVVTDAPFAETKEQLLGFYVVECEDLEQAIETAKALNPGIRCVVRTHNEQEAERLVGSSAVAQAARAMAPGAALAGRDPSPPEEPGASLATCSVIRST